MCFATYKLPVCFSYLLLILIKKRYSQSLIILLFGGIKDSMLLMLLSQNDDDSNENVKNKKMVYQGKPKICTSITFFLYVFLPSLHEHNVKMPNFTFYGRNASGEEFFFLFLNLSAVPKKAYTKF